MIFDGFRVKRRVTACLTASHVALRFRLWRLLLLLACFCFASLATHAQQYRFDSWTTDTGLPQNSVNAILQTRDGYLWLATSDGLVRFDGVRFTVFNKANNRGIRSNRFTTLFEDKRGALWAGTEDGGATRYADGEFTTYTIADGLPDNWVALIREEAATGLIVLTRSGGARLGADNRFAPFEIEAGRTRANIQKIYSRETNSLHFFDADTLHVFDGARYQTFTTRAVISLWEDSNGTLWLVTKDAGIVRFKDESFTSLPTDNPLQVENISFVHEDRAGVVWVGTKSGQLGVLRDGVWTIHDAAHGLPQGSALRNIYEDREGTIWIGTHAGGLYRAQRRVVTVYGAPQGLGNENVYPVVEDKPAGGIWLGVWGAGGGAYSLMDGKLTRRWSHATNNIITALYHDRTGAMWLGDTDLHRFTGDEQTTVWKSSSIVATFIYVISQDHAGDFWLGTKDGLFKFSSGEIRRLTTADGLPHNHVQAITIARDGTLWLGTLGGLCRLRPDGKLESFTEAEGLASNHVRAIYEDRDGTLWIGTYDGGISRLKDNRFTNYTTAEGLHNNGAFAILEDDYGYFWISSNLGIIRISRREMNEFAEGARASVTPVVYGKKDGLLTLECNGGKQPAGVKTSDGRLWFPTQRGVAMIDPRAIGINNLPPPVRVEDVLVDDQTVSFDAAIELAPGQEGIEIRYTGLSFIAPEHVRFRFRLRGLDAEWVDAGTRRVAYYRYLPPGRYTFQVIAANRDGVWNMEGTSLTIIVRPPFWRTWWFLLLALAALIALVIFIYRTRVAKLKRMHAAQALFSQRLIASQEQERKRIAAELHDGLGQNLLVIKNRALLSLNAPDDHARAVEGLSEISDVASQTIEEVREIAHDLRPFQLDRLGLTKALQSVVRKVAASSAIEFTAEVAPVDNLFTKEHEISIYRVVQESLNNIVKHSGATRASVRIERDRRGVVITICDNGKGFDPAMQHASAPGAGGFGLTGISERARMLGGKETIQSARGAGTTITLKIGLRDENRDG
jgi:signal transduction histidine kinase/ligand-binding sensor domain-containing protein